MSDSHEVYLQNGRKAWKLGEVGGKTLVRLMWQGEDLYDDDDFSIEAMGGDLALVTSVFDDPPVAQYHEEIAKLRSEIETIKAERDAILGDIRVAGQQRQQLIDKVRQVPALKRIIEHMEGRVTHYVITGYGKIAIKTHEEALKQRDSWARNRKLVVLFGKSKGCFEWRINLYSDGSGSFGQKVMPCISEDEAKDLAWQVIRDRFPEDKPSEEEIKAIDYIDDTLRDAKALGFGDKLPSWAEEEADKRRQNIASIALEKARSGLRKAEKDAAEAGITDPDTDEQPA